MRKITLLAVIMAAFTFLATAQVNYSLDESKNYEKYPYWIEMMQDPGTNFYATVEAFNRYWKNREITRGSGYKPFKRWEYYWSTRINPDGTFPDGIAVLESYQDFVNENATRENEFTGDWVNLGPIQQPNNAGTGQPNGNGRVNAIAFHPTNEDIIYVGAPAGGLWITTDGGESWVSHTDDLPTLGVSAIIVDHSSPMTVYIGTGDRDAGDAPGMGVMKSEDGGVTFEMASDGMGNVTVGMMIQHPDDNQMILAATSGGVFKTTDGGANWYQTRGGNFKDIVFKVDDPSIIFATADGSFYRSEDTGETWTNIDGDFQGSTRGVIGITPANPEVVYFHTVTGSVYNATYRSNDAGLTFEEKATSPNIMSWNCNGGSGGQGWYDLDVAVDPNNPEILYSGGVNIWKSTNGAESWDINAHWTGSCGVPAVHADCHVLEYNPLNDRLYNGNDGGLYWTDDGGETWNEITSGLAISQIYKISQSATNADKIMNGYQDNGSAVYLGDDEGFLTVMGGDGMDNAIDHQDYRYSYGEYYNGQGITRMFNNIQEGQIGWGISESGAWVTPIELDVVYPETMYAGMKNVWRSQNIKSGNVIWERVSNFNDGSNIRVLEQSEADPNIFYIAKENTGMFRSDNIQEEEQTWTDLTAFVPTSGFASDIETHPTDPDIVYMTINRKVFKSEDRGVNWIELTDNLPDASMNTIEYYKNAQEGLYVGSDAGIYYKDQSMNDWLLFSTGFPVMAEVTEIEFYYDSLNSADDKVRAATYGRGLWTSPAAYSAPVADFMASETEIPTGCALDFTDLSNGVPNSWSWVFEGGTPESSTDENPSGISYESAGNYTVTLTVSNAAGEDTKTITEYITVTDDLLPAVAFYSPDTVFCSPGTSQFIDESAGCPTGWLWEIEPDSYSFVDGTDEQSQHPVVQFEESTAYTIKLTVTNVAGSSELVKESYIQSGGMLTPYVETFEATSLGGSGWSVENPDGEETWQLYEVGGTEPGNMAAGMDFREYQVIGERDRLISPAFNLEGLESAWLTFEHAYAKRWEQHTDSLIIYISGDCGNSWTRIFAIGEDGTGNFATHEPAEDFWPELAEDWCLAGWGASCFSIDLQEWAGQTDIRFAFETYSNFGNPILLDNITVSSMVDIPDVTGKDAEDIMVHPNPASSSVIVVLPENKSLSEISLLNHLGQVVYNTTIEGNDNSVEINRQRNWSDGIYYLQVTGEKESFVKKIILQ